MGYMGSDLISHKVKVYNQKLKGLGYFPALIFTLQQFVYPTSVSISP